MSEEVCKEEDCCKLEENSSITIKELKASKEK